MREDQDVPVRQRRVAADVVGVHVGVDQEADLAVGHGPHGGHQPLGERREQRVDQQDAIRTGEYADVPAAAGAHHHVDLTRCGHDGQLDAGEAAGRILLSGNGDDRNAGGGQNGQYGTRLSDHGRLPPHVPKSSRNRSIWCMRSCSTVTIPISPLFSVFQ